MWSLDFVSGLHNRLEFSQHPLVFTVGLRKHGKRFLLLKFDIYLVIFFSSIFRSGVVSIIQLSRLWTAMNSSPFSWVQSGPNQLGFPATTWKRDCDCILGQYTILFWIQEWARWSKFCVLIGYPDGPIQPAGYSPRWFRKKRFFFLTKLVRSRLLYICLIIILRFYWLISSHLDLTLGQ